MSLHLYLLFYYYYLAWASEGAYPILVSNKANNTIFVIMFVPDCNSSGDNAMLQLP